MCDQNYYQGHRERLRQRFVKDMGASMADYELLELVLMYSIYRKDVKPIAKSLLKEFGNISAVIGVDIEELMKVKGVGKETATLIKLLQTIAGLAAKTEMRKSHILSTWDKLIEYCTIHMAHKSIEQFRVIFLDTRNRIICDEEQTKGSVNQTSIYPREVAKRALSLNATAVILVHNHPSGDPKPSQADIDMTNKVDVVLQSLDIKLHDHLIIGKEDIISFKSAGLL